jgi:hypothetical protein
VAKHSFRYVDTDNKIKIESLNEWKIMRKEAIVGFIKVTFLHSPVEAEENHENPQSKQ